MYKRQTLAPVVLTIGVPDQFQAWNNFQVISISNGVVEVLPDLDADPRTVTVATSNFGVLALVYLVFLFPYRHRMHVPI